MFEKINKKKQVAETRKKLWLIFDRESKKESVTKSFYDLTEDFYCNTFFFRILIIKCVHFLKFSGSLHLALPSFA